MQIPKERILELLRSRGRFDTANHAEEKLPDDVDTQQDAGLLHELGIDPLDVICALGGGACDERQARPLSIPRHR